MPSNLSLSEKIARTKTKNSIESNLDEELLKKQFIKDQISEYMNYYDVIKKINRQLISLEKVDKEYMDLLKEKRQIAKEQRNILDFLKSYGNLKSKISDPEISGADESPL